MNLGYLKSSLGHMLPSFLVHPASLTLNLPSSAYVATCPVFDQGPTSSCVGHAIAAALTRSVGFIPSPEDIYTLARCMGRADLGKLTVPLKDEGSSPEQASRAMSVWGCRPLQGLISDAVPATINLEPTLGDLMQDRKTLAVGQFQVGNLLQIKQALAIAGKPVTVCTYADSTLEDYRALSSPVGAPNTSDKRGGYHYVCVVGYETNANGDTILVVQNSWSSGYGDNGFFHANSDWVAQLTDMIVWDCKVISS